jgi:hypothetical protein
MSQATRLSKAQINAQYYDAVGGHVVFGTEAQSNVYPLVVAKLVAAHARSLGKREIRVLEIGASSCDFAGSLLALIEGLVEDEEADLGKVDYFAADLSETALMAALEAGERDGTYEVIKRFPRHAGSHEPALVGQLLNEGALQINLYLIHAEANTCVSRASGSFDFVILNELLDDMPYRAFYADDAGNVHELIAEAEPGDPDWIVSISSEELGPDAPVVGLPPGRLTATSAESLTLVRAISGILSAGGMLLIHDYGFARPDVAVSQYEAPPRNGVPFARLDFPDGSESGFPRSFFRIFGNEHTRSLQITNDVNFAELVDVLAATGDVIVLPHGNSLFERNPSFKALARGDGVFLSEFGTLGPRDDLPGLLRELGVQQGELRDRYEREYAGGVAAVFNDLIYVKR